jgi:hypothetical protein
MAAFFTEAIRYERRVRAAPGCLAMVDPFAA